MFYFRLGFLKPNWNAQKQSRAKKDGTLNAKREGWISIKEGVAMTVRAKVNANVNFLWFAQAKNTFAYICI